VGILAIIMSPIVGKMLSRYDPRLIATFAFLVFSLISFMRADFSTDVDIGAIMLPTFIQGAAMATFFIPLTTVSLSGLAPHRIPAAAGLSNFVRLVFGAFGTSITTTLWENRASLHHAQLAEVARPGEPAFDAAMSGLQSKGVDLQHGAALVDRLIDQQAFTLSATDIFYASGVLFLAMIALIWVTKPQVGKPSDAGAGAH